MTEKNVREFDLVSDRSSLACYFGFGFQFY